MISASDNPTVHTATLAGIEAAVNRVLALDPATPRLLAPLAGRVFEIHCTEPRINLFATIEARRLRLSGWHDGPVDTALRGRAEDFLALARASDPTAALINGAVELHGDSTALLQLQKAVKALQPDWEAPLARVFGDVLGHQLGSGLRGAARWLQRAGRSLRRQTDEYLVEESGWFPHRSEVENFYREVETLQQHSERLAARLERLRQTRVNTAPGHDR